MTAVTLMTDEQLAKRLQVPVSWVKDKAKAGEIPHTFIGRHRRYTEKHFEQIVAAGNQPVRGARRRTSGRAA
ncbi:helix-turn-helix domain-containing protein [Plantactinospora solaniradicis]|uniref:Helix-turn-helix domain-containing protein n=1 Tax=Plantactinospora solaniradicis TaxID=1723736 RepID=A0ABW1K9E0_9ACTN